MVLSPILLLSDYHSDAGMHRSVPTHLTVSRMLDPIVRVNGADRGFKSGREHSLNQAIPRLYGDGNCSGSDHEIWDYSTRPDTL